LNRKYQAIGLLLVLVLALALLPTVAMAIPVGDQGVQGVVKDASGIPIPFAEMRVKDDPTADYEYFVANYDGTYSYPTPPGLTVELVAAGVNHQEDVAFPVVVAADAFTTEDFTLDRDAEFYQPVYRFFNMTGGVHFYTASDAEFIDVYKNMAALHYQYDGIGYWVAQGPDIEPTLDSDGAINHNTVPLYRFFNKRTLVHFYTADVAEMNNVKNNMKAYYNYEGEAYKVSDSDQYGQAIFRFYNPGRYAHFYTADDSEIWGRKSLSAIYQFEGIGFYSGGWEWVPRLVE